MVAGWPKHAESSFLARVAFKLPLPDGNFSVIARDFPPSKLLLDSDRRFLTLFSQATPSRFEICAALV